MANNTNITTSFLKAASERSAVARAVLKDNTTQITPEDSRQITQIGFNQVFADALNELTTKNQVTLPNGDVYNAQSLGGVLSMNIYFQNLVGAKTIMVKIPDKILDFQNTSLTSHKF